MGNMILSFKYCNYLILDLAEAELQKFLCINTPCASRDLISQQIALLLFKSHHC